MASRISPLRMAALLAVPEPEVTGRAFARFWRQPNGNKRFVVMLRGVPRDVYDVGVNGASVGTLSVDLDGTGEVVLELALEPGDEGGIVDPGTLEVVLSAIVP